MKRLLYIILYMVLAVHASAQMRVTGRVIDLQNKPVSDVIVKMVSGTKTLAFTSTNAKGEYALELKSATSGEVSLQFTHISYEKESERLSLKERVTKVDMVLTPKAVSLKEVTVKPDPLRQRGDTLSHNLASFLGKGDVTLEDGLKRLPGVDVSQNGGISYMGKPISQFAQPPQPTGGEGRAEQRGVDEHQTVEQGEVQAVRAGRGGSGNSPPFGPRGGYNRPAAW